MQKTGSSKCRYRVDSLYEPAEPLALQTKLSPPGVEGAVTSRPMLSQEDQIGSAIFQETRMP
ncbi:MAG: hypothetical protein WAW20_15875 [Anaerolineae bacterium]|mgnify:CR=1 FL=1